MCIIHNVCGLSGSTIVFHIISQTARFSGKNLLNIICALIFYRILSGTFLILRRIQRYVRKSSCTSKLPVPVILVRLQSNMNFLDRLSKNSQMSNFMRIHPVGAELFHKARCTDGRTDMTKLIVAFPNFTNAPLKRKRSWKVCAVYKQWLLT